MNTIKINPALDIEELQEYYNTHQMVVISDFLEATSASALHEFLSHDMPPDWWYTSYKIPTISTTPVMVRRTHDNLQQISQIYPTAYIDFANGMFTYIFDRSTYHVNTCTCLECEYKEFLQSSQFIDLVASVTGLTISARGEVFTSRYTAGQFLSPHHDIAKGQLSVIYGLTLNWKPEWGGNLHILEDDWRTITRVITPSYNTLVLTLMNSPDGTSRVGLPHFVSQVAGGVTQPRLSITGWIS